MYFNKGFNFSQIKTSLNNEPLTLKPCYVSYFIIVKYHFLYLTCHHHFSISLLQLTLSSIRLRPHIFPFVSICNKMKLRILGEMSGNDIDKIC